MLGRYRPIWQFFVVPLWAEADSERESPQIMGTNSNFILEVPPKALTHTALRGLRIRRENRSIFALPERGRIRFVR
jgi:hypothetical protein